MVIDVAYVRDIRTECMNAFAKTLPRFPRVNGVRREPDLVNHPGSGFEIAMRDEVPVIVSLFRSTRVGHREQRHFMALLAHELHKFEQVNLSAAEREAVLVAVEDPHIDRAPKSGSGSGRQSSPNLFHDGSVQ